MQNIVESVLVTVLGLLISQFRGKFHMILAGAGAKLKAKVAATKTTVDDLALGELVDAFITAFVPAVVGDTPQA